MPSKGLELSPKCFDRKGKSMDAHTSYRDWKNWDAASFGRYTPADVLYFAAECSRAGIVNRAGTSVLELGFGNGSFAGWARAQGWQYQGVEDDAVLVERANAAGFRAHTTAISLDRVVERDSLDLVIAFDVLEHLEHQEIVELLRTMRMLLKGEGYVIARVPSGDSPFGRAIQNGDITHKSIIGSGIVQQLAVRAGYRVQAIRPPAFPVFGLGLRTGLRRATVATIRTLVRYLVQKVYFDNQSRVVESNMLIILRPEKIEGAVGD